MSSLQQILKDLTEQSRIEAIEASFNGSAIAQTNHKARFAGFDRNGRSLVKVDGKLIAANNIGATTPKPNQKVYLRTGKNIRVIDY